MTLRLGQGGLGKKASKQNLVKVNPRSGANFTVCCRIATPTLAKRCMLDPHGTLSHYNNSSLPNHNL